MMSVVFSLLYSVRFIGVSQLPFDDDAEAVSFPLHFAVVAAGSCQCACPTPGFVEGQRTCRTGV